MADTAVSPADLVRMVNGMMVSQVLHVIATLGVADLLAAGPQTSEDLAPVVHAIPRPLYRLMRAAASLGVPAEDETGAFCLTPLGQYMRTDHPQSVRGWAVYTGDPAFWGTWQHLRHAITTGESEFDHLHGMPFWQYLVGHPDTGAAFNDAMSSRSLEQRDALVAAYHFGAARTVVDVGGGRGRAVVCRPGRQPRNARNSVRPSPRSGRRRANATRSRRCRPLRRCRGEFLRGRAGWGRRVPAQTHRPRLVGRTGAVHSADLPSSMMPDAKLLLAERVVAPGNVADPAKLTDLIMLIMHGGQERTEVDFAALYTAAGFRLTRVIPTNSELSLIEGAPA
jgi:O-methyltransferase/methyltransferase family protein